MKCNLPVYLLILLIEECAEVIHRACKAIRFGLEERQTTPFGHFEKDNRHRLQEELTDLQAIVQMNQKEGNLDFMIAPTVAITDKKSKVRKYMLYSRDDCGTLDATDEEIKRQ